MVKRSLLITILIIVLLVVYYLLGMDYMKQRKEHEALASQIADVTQILEQMPEPPQDIEQRLAAAQASLADEQNAFPSKVSSTKVINTILKLADECDVKAIPMVTQPWSTEDVEEHGYDVFWLNVAVEGSPSKLLTFVSKLENGEFKTLILENLSLTMVDEQSEVTASLELAIYTQSLTSD